MGVMELFSKRQKKLRGQVPDVYQYDDIPDPLRVQIVHIVRDALGSDHYSDKASKTYELIHQSLCREYGVFTLEKNANSDLEAVFSYFLKCPDYERVLDVIETSFKVINTLVREYDYRNSTQNRKIEPDDAIEELNARFKEHGVGYQFESNEIFRVDSQFMHSEAVKPTLTLLGSKKGYKGANEEFLKAHEHYRHRRYKESLVEALKAFESVMKTICHNQKWEYNQTDTAKKLIEILFLRNLVPSYLQSQFSSLRTLLESGVPTVRNKLGGHGQGAVSVTVTESLANYALNLSAANILLLVNLEKENFS